jgi:adenylosuccinate lyase
MHRWFSIFSYFSALKNFYSMEINPLKAISPLDGRYRSQIEELSVFFSEYGLIQYRVMVEIEYFIALCQIPLPQLAPVEKTAFKALRSIYQEFSMDDAARVKEIEKTTNHDVKAVEYFLKEKFATLGLESYKEFIHFGLTSQDINNTAIPLLLKEALHDVYLPRLNDLLSLMASFASQYMDLPMLARTHGQPASPTTFGKEFLVFHARVKEQLNLLINIPHAAKFGGATGNFNANVAAYPGVDWSDFANHFLLNVLGLKRSYPTTQIEHYDYMAALFDAMKRINNILIDFSRDVWQYISLNYLKQKIKKDEVGSSAMPHKVNPIDFENAEGNLGFANAIFEHLSAKLPISRLQRDLSDSTVLRNIGIPIAHSYISFLSLIRGMGKIEVNEDAIRRDLDDHWVVISEGIQTILRREGYPDPFEAVKGLTRTNKKINMQVLHKFIDQLNVSEMVKTELKQLTPFNYLGVKYFVIE